MLSAAVVIGSLWIKSRLSLYYESSGWSEWLALPTSDHEVPGLNPSRGWIQLMTEWRFIAQSLPLSPFHCLDMT